MIVSDSDVSRADTSAARTLGHDVPVHPTSAVVSSVPIASNVAADAGAATTSSIPTRAKNVRVQRIISSLLNTSLNRADRRLASNVRPSVNDVAWRGTTYRRGPST